MLARLGAGLVLVASMLPACGDDRDGPYASDVEDRALAGAVDVRAIGCRTQDVRGAGAVLAGGLVATAAHVVAGADTITVRAATSDTPVEATIVAFDPVNDIALLAADDIGATPLDIASTPADGGAVIVVFRDDEPVVTPVTITQRVIVHILDIFHEREIDRPGYIVTVDIDPGDSGAVVVSGVGTAAGILYATSRSAENRSFATDATAFDALLATAATAEGARPADSTRCAP